MPTIDWVYPEWNRPHGPATRLMSPSYLGECRGKQRTVRAAEPASTDNRQLEDLTGSFTSIDGVF